MTLRVLDLFSGIGGFSLGLESTGAFETVAFCETDPYASKVLHKWWPTVPNIAGGVIALNALLRRARTSSRPGFRARTFLLPGQAPDWPEPARDSYGHSCEPFAWYDPASRSWRTWQRCLLEGWATYSGTWPRSGMTRSGIAYRRAPLVPLTAATASGLSLPTPTATGNMMSPSMQKWPAHRNLRLTRETWPTPTATLGSKGGRVTPRKSSEGGTLIEAVAARQFATPTARDWRSVKASPETHDRNSRPLSEQVGGSLNPTWVEWLMGFHHEWTALDASATPSCRRSSNTSGDN